MMGHRNLVLLSLAAGLAACSADTPTTPTAATGADQSVLAYSVQVLVSQGSLGSTAGVKSPASVELTFRTVTGVPLEIDSATVSLLDGAGGELTRQTFAASQGLLSFRPTWDGGVVGRTMRLTLSTKANDGTLRSTDINVPL
ncbi:MAG: hypothetical protein ABI672_09220 [Vicinamibacteria bacterium]